MVWGAWKRRFADWFALGVLHREGAVLGAVGAIAGAIAGEETWRWRKVWRSLRLND
jgi:hypothetical protein